MIGDVVELAWSAIGRPEVVEPSGAGTCARCGRDGTTVPVGEVVTKWYSGWGTWAHPAGSAMCLACAWSFRSPLLRSVPHWVRREPALVSVVSGGELSGLLGGGLSGADSVVLPLRPGRKHIIQAAEWGCVVTEEGVLRWGAGDAARLGVAHRLLGLGLSWSDLAAGVPSWSVLSRCTNAQVCEVLELWGELRPWRVAPQWLRVAARTGVVQGLVRA